MQIFMEGSEGGSVSFTRCCEFNHLWADTDSVVSNRERNLKCGEGEGPVVKLLVRKMYSGKSCS